MLLRWRKRHRRGHVSAAEDPYAGLDDSVTTEGMLEEIATLSAENRERRDLALERRILALRHSVGLRRIESADTTPADPEPRSEGLSNGSGPPEVAPDELSPALVRAAILEYGCLLVRGAGDPDEATRMATEIDRAFDAREAQRVGNGADPAHYDEFTPDPRFDLGPERGWVAMDGGGMWTADSPHLMFDLLELFERAGLSELGTGYLGERPALSVNKCTLRRVMPGTGAGHDMWHQDGAFMGEGVRALNVWLSLSRCGDEAPGLDLVPRRVDHVLPTGTEGAVFEWSISRAVTEEAAGDAPIVRPIFNPGDALLFDELCVHSTAADPEMQRGRYAIETWMFGPFGFPTPYAPIAL